MADQSIKVSRVGGVMETFTLRLGTTASPLRRSQAIRELRRHLDAARANGWTFAEPFWGDEGQTTVNVLFENSRTAAMGTRAW